MYFHSQTFIKSLEAAFSKGKRSSRHLRFLLPFLGLFFLFRTLAVVGRQLDRLFFPGYRRQQIKAPIYIIANPRSGTTFLHRLLSLDDRFTNFKLYHTLLPSIFLIKSLEALSSLDEKVGRPLGRCIDSLNSKGFQGWKGIHETRLNEPEEDEQLFLYTMLSPSLFMLFPFFDELAHVAFVDRLPQPIRNELMSYYRDCIQRRLHLAGGGKTLLAKNVLIHGRLRSTTAALPDMRIIHIVRHPYETVPSFISMYDAFWNLYGSRMEWAQGLAEILCRYYRYFWELRSQFPDDQFLEIRYEDLIADPATIVKQIYQKFHLNMTDEFLSRLEVEVERARGYRSSHLYTPEQFGLSRKMIHEKLGDVFDAYGFEP